MAITPDSLFRLTQESQAAVRGCWRGQNGSLSSLIAAHRLSECRAETMSVRHLISWWIHHPIAQAMLEAEDDG